MQKLFDPAWRWKHLYYIRSDEGIVKIRQRPDQLELWNLIYPAFKAGEKLDLAILKNRQRGTSTWCGLLCEDLSAYYPGKVANTIADTQPNAGKIFRNVVKLAWNRIPKGLKPRATTDNVNTLDFERIGSKYIVSASKSEPVDILHISEAPYFQDDGKITEAEQMLRPNGIEIMESTAFGVGNLFEKRFMTAWNAQKAGKYHHRKAIFFPWFTDPTNIVPVHPEMELKHAAFILDLAETIKQEHGHDLSLAQQHFYDQKFEDLEEEVFQFYPTEPEEAFLHSGRPVFNQDMLKTLKRRHERPPIRITDDGIALYAEPVPGRHYGIGVDCAEGLAGGDNSVVIAVDSVTGEEVAQIAGKISALDESELAAKVSAMGRLFPDHNCVIERNNHGHTVIAYVKDDPYLKLYKVEVKDKILDQETDRIGWETDGKSKAFLISELKRDLKHGKCIPHDVETHEELRVFVHGERGKMGALPGHQDDRVIALGLAMIGAANKMEPQLYVF